MGAGEDFLIFGMGNPLLDISVKADESLLKQFDLKANNAILAEEQHLPLYDYIVKNLEVQYIAGGATQNSMRLAQWIIGKPHSTVYMGCVGVDEESHILEQRAREAGVHVCYQYSKLHRTGRCAAIITNNGKDRCLVADLGAANFFTKEHLELEENWSLVEKSRTFYISGFFLTSGVESTLKIAQYAHLQHKVFCMNMSAPFICTLYKEQFLQVLPYVDILFGSKEEALALVEALHLDDSKDVTSCAQNISLTSYLGTGKQRTVIITQAADPVIVAKNGVVEEIAVPQLAAECIVDTNGAGDAFVGGFLAQYVQNQPFQKCIDCAIWAAQQIIQQSGFTLPEYMSYVES